MGESAPILKQAPLKLYRWLSHPFSESALGFLESPKGSWIGVTKVFAIHPETFKSRKKIVGGN